MLKQYRQQLIVISFSLVLMLVFYFVPFRINGELWMYDRRLELMRNVELNKDLQFVSIDQDSQDHYGAFPWKRSVYVDLLKAMQKTPPQVAVFDIMFTEKKPEDGQFAEALNQLSYPVVLSFFFKDPLPGSIGRQVVEPVPVVPQLKEAAKYDGFVKAIFDMDGKVRSACLAVNVDGKMLPSIDLMAFALYRGVKPEEIKYEHKKIFVGSTVIPTDKDYSIYINYSFPEKSGKDGGTEKSIMPSRGFYKIIEKQDTEGKTDLTDKIVIIGAGTVGLQDDFETPLMEEGRVYGSVIHANIINTLLLGRYLNPAPVWINYLFGFLVALLYSIYISKFYQMKNIILFSLGMMIGFTVLNMFLFKIGWWLWLFSPLMTIFSCTLVVLAVQFFRTHKMFREFVVPEIADKMVQSDKFAETGGEDMLVSILFSDIRGYTSLSENLTPGQVVDMLNEYHDEMVTVYEKYDGRVVDYMGDAQMVIFGYPIERDDHALCAVNAGLEAQEALKSLCQKWNVENRTSFEVGIGICTGFTSICVVGAEGRKKQFTAIGDTTNVASRLQGQSKVLGAPIILNPLAAELVSGYFETRLLGTVPLKGKSEPMEAYTIGQRKE